jgi:signal transduction histidine kinase
MPPMRLSFRDVRRLAGTALTITGAWLCAGMFFTWQHRTLNPALNTPEDLELRIVGMTAPMFVWALFTPFVVWVSDLLPLRKPALLRNVLLITLFGCAVAIARAIIDASIPSMLEEFPMTFDYWTSVLALFHTHLLFAFIVIGVANFMRLEREEKERGNARARLESQLAEARLRQLSADMHPHFLFNTLNAVAALLHRDAAAAGQMLGKLRELLQASVANEAAREVPLHEELAFLERYFDIQKMRFGDKLASAIHVSEPHLQHAAIPPLLLQPLVENSIVHGVGRRRDGGTVVVLVDVEKSGDEEWLRLQVRDNGPGAEPSAIYARGSIGVPNAKARLESIYGAQQSLTYTRSGEAFVAEVRIPLRMTAA